MIYLRSTVRPRHELKHVINHVNERHAGKQHGVGPHMNRVVPARFNSKIRNSQLYSCRNRRIIAELLAVVVAVTISGCSDRSVSTVNVPISDCHNQTMRNYVDVYQSN